MEKFLPTWPFLALLAVALWGITDGLRDGRWLTVALNTVTVAIALWGLRRSHRRARYCAELASTSKRSGCARDLQPAPSAQAPNRAPLAQPDPRPTAAPVIKSFTVAAELRPTVSGATARLTIVVPDEVLLTPAVIISALLTLGHRVLGDTGFTDQDLPEVEAIGVARASSIPILVRGFTLAVTNDLAARRSSITLGPQQLAGATDDVLLIAATLLAGADHLLEPGDHLTHRRAITTHAATDRRAPRHR